MERTREGLIEAVRAEAARRGTRRLKLAEFCGSVPCSYKVVYDRFETWAELCEAAGLEFVRRGVRPPDEAVFAALRDGFTAAGGIVTRAALRRHLPGGALPDRHWGGWFGLLAAFRDWARDNAPDFPYPAALDAYIASGLVARQKRRNSLNPPQPMPTWPAGGGSVMGPPLGFRALLHEPVNEHGVVLLFGMVAEELGFAVDTVRPAFPDCEAKRRTAPGRWERVRVEFEFRSRCFRDHGHDPAGCDLIVCWDHDWPDCPLEVLELRSAIADLPAAAA